MLTQGCFILFLDLTEEEMLQIALQMSLANI